MHAEISPIQVITGIEDAAHEEYLAQLLDSLGWRIINRSVDWQGARAAIAQIRERTLFLFTTDLPGFSSVELQESLSDLFIPLALDDIEFNAHPLMTVIHNAVRRDSLSIEYSIAPRIHDSPMPSVVLITGTSGAPGRSTLAIEVASILAQDHSVHLIDGDLKSPSLQWMLEERGGVSNLSLSTINPFETPTTPSLNPTHINIIDTGELPSLADVMNDRRWQGALLHSALSNSRVLIYVVKADYLGVKRLEKFISEIMHISHPLDVIFILNQLGSTRFDKQTSDRFTSLMSGRIHFIIPHESRTSLFGRGLIGSRSSREIARIATQISEYLT